LIFEKLVVGPAKDPLASNTTSSPTNVVEGPFRVPVGLSAVAVDLSVRRQDQVLAASEAASVAAAIKRCTELPSSLRVSR